MPAIFEVSRIVQPHEIDEQGHVNNVEYLRWLQEAAVEHSAAQGWTKQRYLESGAVFVARSHHIEYLQSAFVGDEIKIVTWVSSFGKLTTLRKYLVVRPGDKTVLVRAETNWAFVSWPQRTPRRCPVDLVEAFVLISEEHEPKA